MTTRTVSFGVRPLKKFVIAKCSLLQVFGGGLDLPFSNLWKIDQVKRKQVRLQIVVLFCNLFLFQHRMTVVLAIDAVCNE